FNQKEYENAKRVFEAQKPEELIESFKENRNIIAQLLGPINWTVIALNQYLDDLINNTNNVSSSEISEGFENILRNPVNAFKLVEEPIEPESEKDIESVLEDDDSTFAPDNDLARTIIYTKEWYKTQELEDDKSQTSTLCSLYTYFNDRIKLKKALAEPKSIQTKSFTSAENNNWQSSSISISGAHTARNSDVIFTNQEKNNSVLAGVADGVSICPPDTNYCENKLNGSQKSEVEKLYELLTKGDSDDPIFFEFLARSYSQIVAETSINAITDLDPNQDLNSIKNHIRQQLAINLQTHRAFNDPQKIARGGSTISFALDTGDNVKLFALGDSPIYYFDQSDQSVKLFGLTNHSNQMPYGISFENIFGNPAAFINSKHLITQQNAFFQDTIKKSNIGWIMIASDGILGREPNPEKFIEFLKSKFPNGQKDLDTQTLVQAGLEFAKANNSDDDISISVIKPQAPQI
ncbi:MAG: hypothetical protein LW817_07615, partial [Candidatus Caenarcaniphilales bacterium]|nr:hypothetical protein [Candidatus Caenarcaniphilales bacterium]